MPKRLPWQEAESTARDGVLTPRQPRWGLATATASPTSSTPPATTAGTADDNYASSSNTAGGADPQGGDNLPGDPPSAPQPPAAPTPPGDTAGDDSRSSDPLKAERRKNNHLEKEIRTLRKQLNRFSEINPEEYARLQEAERQKQILEERMELRERQMEEASAQRVAAGAAERDEARSQVLQLRKDRLLERAFSQAEGRTGGDRRGTFFDIFKGQLGGSWGAAFAWGRTRTAACRWRATGTASRPRWCART